MHFLFAQYWMFSGTERTIRGRIKKERRKAVVITDFTDSSILAGVVIKTKTEKWRINSHSKDTTRKEILWLQNTIFSSFTAKHIPFNTLNMKIIAMLFFGKTDFLKLSLESPSTVSYLLAGLSHLCTDMDGPVVMFSDPPSLCGAKCMEHIQWFLLFLVLLSVCLIPFL